jgi:hypothetical protein
MAPDRPGYDTLGNPIRPSRLPGGSAHPSSVDQSMLKKDLALIELRDLQRTNETKQRICALPVCVLK